MIARPTKAGRSWRPLLISGYPGRELGLPLSIGGGDHGFLLGRKVDAAGLDRYRIDDRVGLAWLPGSGRPTTDRNSLALLASQRVHLLVEQFVLLAKVSNGVAELGDVIVQALVLLAAGATDPVFGRSDTSLARFGAALRAWPFQIWVLDGDYAFRQSADVEATYEFGGGKHSCPETYTAEPPLWPDDPLSV